MSLWQSFDDTESVCRLFSRGRVATDFCLFAKRRLFLAPRTHHLLACLEFASVFIERCCCSKLRAGCELKPFLPELLSLLSRCALLADAAGGSVNDWRVAYKTLATAERLFAKASPLPVDEALGDLRASLRKLSTPQVLDFLTGDGESGEKPLAQSSLAREDAAKLLAKLEFWEGGEEASPGKSAGSDPEGDAAVVPLASGRLGCGLRWAHLWTAVVGRGLSDENAWIRCAALRCVTAVLRKQLAFPSSRLRGSSPRLFSLLRVRIANLERRRLPQSAASSPLSDLAFALLKHVGADDLLERHPDAAPLAASALLAWIRSALLLPGPFHIPRRERVREKTRASAHARQTEPRGFTKALEPSQSDAAAETPDRRRLESFATNDELSPSLADEASGAEPQTACGKREEEGGTHEPSKLGLPKDSTEESVERCSEGEEPTLDESAASSGSASDGEDPPFESSSLIWEALESEGLSEARSPLTPKGVATNPHDDKTTTNGELPGTSATAGEDSSPFGRPRPTDAASLAQRNPRVDPVLHICRALNRWLRIHLGRLGFRGPLGLKRESSNKLSAFADKTPGTVVRVSAILGVFHALAKLLPFESLLKPEADGGVGEVVRLTLFEVLDACFRCSSLAHRESGSDAVLLPLLNALDEREFSTQEEGPSGETEKHSTWKTLRELSPVKQLGEVADSAKATLRRLEKRMRVCGVGEVYAATLATVQERVSERRVRRRLREKALLLTEPKKHAQRRRRRNLGKSLRKKARVREGILRRHGFVKRKAQR